MTRDQFVNEIGLEEKIPAPLREKGQYALAFGVISALLYVTGFPIFLLFFIGVLTFFIWKVFSSEWRPETRRIFEFYLSANEILREDDRRWYGFEIQETIANGERIVRSMSAAPPLVYFALGALYQKIADHSSAVKNLSHILDEAGSDESAVAFPTKELREYVHMLRKIERSPSEAPQTSSAIRSLERSRKNCGRGMLEHSRLQIAKGVVPLPLSSQKLESVVDIAHYRESEDTHEASPGNFGEKRQEITGQEKRKQVKREESKASNTERKTISEVLHDIYDHNIQ